MGEKSEQGDFDMLQTQAEILKQIEPIASSSQLLGDHLPLLSKEYKAYFPTTPKKKWIHDLFVYEPSESRQTISWKLQSSLKISNLRSHMMVGLKVHLRQLQFSIYSGLGSKQNILRLPEKQFHFQYLSDLWEAVFCGDSSEKIMEISSILQVSLFLVPPQRGQLVIGKQAQGSYQFCIILSCIIMSLCAIL